MIKTIFCLFCFLFIPSLIYAQLFPYNPRKWNPDWAYTKFSDSFSGTLLDKSKWEVVKNYGQGKCVFVDSVGTTYSVNNGLGLKMIYHPGYCYEVNGTIECPNYISAEIVSKDRFKYGIYEGRMKFATGRGSWPAFWFYGGSGADDPQYNNAYASEIDIAEYNWHRGWLGAYSVTNDHVFHWWWPESIHGTQQMDIPNGIKNNSVDWNTSHTFKLIYTPYKCEFYIDGIFSWQRSRYYTIVNGSPQDISPEDINASTSYLEWEWFPKHEGQIILSQQVSKYIYNGDISAPQTSLFEWVTFKQFFLAPEITCPTVICSTGTATMDVDPAATNISWTLTPSNLFSGTTAGSGKIANITRASGAIGSGKITYSFQMQGETFYADKGFCVGMVDDTKIVSSRYGQSVGAWAQYRILCNTGYTTVVAGYDSNGDGEPFGDSGYPSSQSISGYEWSFPSGWSYTSTGVGNPNERIQVTAQYPYPSIGQMVQVGIRAQNGCGWTNWKYDYWQVVSCSSYKMTVSPNPVASEATIELISTSEERAAVLPEWGLEVYSSMQSLKTKTTKLKAKTYKLNTQGWQNGVYVVRAKIGDEIISEKLVVKH